MATRTAITNNVREVSGHFALDFPRVGESSISFPIIIDTGGALINRIELDSVGAGRIRVERSINSPGRLIGAGENIRFAMVGFHEIFNSGDSRLPSDMIADLAESRYLRLALESGPPIKRLSIQGT